MEQNAQAHAEFAARIGEYTPEQLVFVDESAVDRWTTYCGYAWSLKGHQATCKTFFCRGRRWLLSFFLKLALTHVLRFSVLSALLLNDGILHCDIVEGLFDSQLFYQFIERLLNQMQPYLSPNSVIVMDNCRIHKHPAILELVEQRWVPERDLYFIIILTSLLQEGCASNFSPHTPLITTQSSSHFLLWNTIFVEMVNMLVWPWLSKVMRRFSLFYLQLFMKSQQQESLGGIAIVNMYSRCLNACLWIIESCPPTFISPVEMSHPHLCATAPLSSTCASEMPFLPLCGAIQSLYYWAVSSTLLSIRPYCHTTITPLSWAWAATLPSLSFSQMTATHRHLWLQTFLCFSHLHPFSYEQIITHKHQ